MGQEIAQLTGKLADMEAEVLATAQRAAAAEHERLQAQKCCDELQQELEAAMAWAEEAQVQITGTASWRRRVNKAQTSVAKEELRDAASGPSGEGLGRGGVVPNLVALLL